MPDPAANPSVAVLGGGQLGRMLGLAGVPLGVTFRFLDPSADAGAASVGELLIGELGDPAAVARVAAGVDVVTYEWEGVPAAMLAPIVDDGTMVWPPPAALDVSQDRLREKQHFAALGIDTATFAAVDDCAGLDAAIAAIGLPGVLKTRRGGYDGKGQVVLRDPEDTTVAWDELGAAGPLIFEAFVPFDRELSILAVRNVDGDTRIWPLVENHHADGILRVSRSPAPDLTELLEATARRYVIALLDELDYVGVLALELFEVDGALLANEFAPRVHNSGHWTIDGSVTSQFEQHVRAVCGLPLGDTEVVRPAAIYNLLGDLWLGARPPDIAGVLALPGVRVHLYGKREARAGRKMGHLSACGVSSDAALERLVDAYRRLSISTAGL